MAVVQPPALQLPSIQDRIDPILLDGRVYTKQVELQLPAGFTVDEMPTPVHFEAPFAGFKLAYRQENGKLILEEELRTETVTLPAAEYPVVKKFFDNVIGADGQNAVLVKN